MKVAFVLLALAVAANARQPIAGTTIQERNESPLDSEVEAPQFVLQSERSETGGPQIHVYFPNGVRDTMVLQRYNPFGLSEEELAHERSCAYTGHFEGQEEDSQIAVSGCMEENRDSPYTADDHLDITMFTPHSRKNMFKLFKNGEVEVMKNPMEGITCDGATFDRADSWNLLVGGDEKESAGIEQAAGKVDQQCLKNGGCKFPKKMRVKMQLGYERTFRNQMIKEGKSVKSYLTSAMAHTQAHWKLPSLYTQVEFQIVSPILYKEAKWTADKDLPKARLIQPLSGVDVVTWFCDDPEEYGTVGMGYVGGLCTGSYKANLNEHRKAGIPALSKVVAHELGHNFGMSHDFDAKHKGKGCKGLMDYDDSDGWSLCSVYDFLQHYDSEKWSGSCLDIVDSTKGKAIPKAPTKSNPAGPTTTPKPPSNCKKSFIGDGFCDDENNNQACQFDGGDCCGNTKTGWNKYCKECKCKNVQCQTSFIKDGYCDDKNNNPSCKYDGGDCCNNNKPGWNKYCKECKCKQ